jgi:hypothetical protein
MGVHQRYPETHAKSPKTLPRRRAERADAAFVQYVVGDLNALRQDLHGELAFPEPDHDFIGDEYVLTACQVALRSCRCAGAVLPLSPCTTVP